MAQCSEIEDILQCSQKGWLILDFRVKVSSYEMNGRSCDGGVCSCCSGLNAHCSMNGEHADYS